MFGQCCHCQDRPAEKNQITYDPVPEKNFAEDTVLQQQQQQQQQPAQQETSLPGPEKGKEPPLSQRSESSLTPEEKAAEKARLQELVKRFAKSAVQGIVCDILDPTSGAVRKGKYSIDKQLKKMTMRMTEGADLKQTFGLSSIQEIFRVDDGEPHFPDPVRGLADAEKDKALLIIYVDDGGQIQQLCFFEATPMDKERFLTCMKILRLYSQTTTPKDSGR